ncbi:hypothetical protein RO3G_13553 [Rhizopus delemar RA 99-880]|uniref:Uncharacterized protein n=1 Tax=Rhizopus delemar (strain RA 99-880 / ATCC MYA-4621 / FGSC 9543 / NRRL 43880) TaxID=246409 RepID=I1CK62_RHIO9|nr:hypothetical protein RO3G_13553 [Rhizopus delemar RA 99-880]|eukprot:EIE88842.1 hypothetical protein RO3G_13553 [Rhizopus delemar RA 99-880]
MKCICFKGILVLDVKNTCQILKTPNCSSIFEDLSTLRLSKYDILHYHDKFTIYDFFATVIRFILKAHWQQFFEQTPVVDEIVVNQIPKELLKPSAYNSLC